MPLRPSSSSVSETRYLPWLSLAVGAPRSLLAEAVGPKGEATTSRNRVFDRSDPMLDHHPESTSCSHAARCRRARLAERAGINAASLAGPEERPRQGIRFTTLDALRTALDCEPGDLIR